MNKKFNVIIQNLAILMLVFSGIAKIIYPFLGNRGIMHYFYRLYIRVYPQTIVIHNSLNIIIGFLTLFLVFKLYKRIWYAWLIEVSMLSVSIVFHIMSIVLHVMKTFRLSSILLWCEVFILIVLLVHRKDFKRRSDKITVKYGAITALFSYAW